MTQIEQIKAEVERLKREIPYHENPWSVLNKVLDFINSLPAEQPSEDLKKAAKDFVEKNSPYTDEFMLDNEVEEAYKIAELTFKRGAQWQKEQMMKSAVDATCVLLPPPDVFKVLICHEVTDKLTIGQKTKVIVKEDE